MSNAETTYSAATLVEIGTKVICGMGAPLELASAVSKSLVLTSLCSINLPTMSYTFTLTTDWLVVFTSNKKLFANGFGYAVALNGTSLITFEVGEEIIAGAAQPRYRKAPYIEQRAKKRGKEHDFRENEPAHSHPKRLVYLQVVGAAFTFRDHVAEPAGHHGHQDGNANQEKVFAEGGFVKPGRGANHQREKSD